MHIDWQGRYLDRSILDFHLQAIPLSHWFSKSAPETSVSSGSLLEIQIFSLAPDLRIRSPQGGANNLSFKSPSGNCNARLSLRTTAGSWGRLNCTSAHSSTYSVFTTHLMYKSGSKETEDSGARAG